MPVKKKVKDFDLNGEIAKYWDEWEYDEFGGTQTSKGINTFMEIDVPSLRKIKQPKMPLYDKITWVLTIVNVAILITLIIKNVWNQI